MRRRMLIVAAVLAAALGVAQFFAPERANPPVRSEVPAPEPVRAALRASCYDCHSNETRWPWYSRVAPASWLVAHDVAEGREHVNFSEWDRYSDEKRRKLFEEIREEVAEGEMPMAIYTLLHPEARLGPDGQQLIIDWARGDR